MKQYSLFRLKCKCSARMKQEGKVVKIYEQPAIRKCPNCGRIYGVQKKGT